MHVNDLTLRRRLGNDVPRVLCCEHPNFFRGATGPLQNHSVLLSLLCTLHAILPHCSSHHWPQYLETQKWTMSIPSSNYDRWWTQVYEG